MGRQWSVLKFVIMDESRCVNCSQIVTTPFCPHCGQKRERKRITLLSLYHDFQSRIYGFDGMFPRTVKDLTLNPGRVAAEFVDGNRVKYVGPVGYFFLMITLYLLLLSILEIDFFEYATTNNPFSIEGTTKQQEFTRRLMDIVSKNLRIFSFLIVPITGIWARIFFRQSGLNWLEHTVPVFYVQGHINWLTIVNVFVFFFWGWSIGVYEALIGFLFYGFACTGFYAGDNKSLTFFRGLFVAIFSILTFQILVAIFAFVYLFLDPDMVKLMKEGS